MPSTLGAGDKIHLNISSHKTLSKNHQLNTKGEITLPFAGPIKLDGLTPTQAAKRVTQRLSTHYRGLSGVKVVILTHQKFIWLRGWVKKPGRYLLKWQESIGELLSKGGGAQPGARLDKVWLHSPGLSPRTFNLLTFYQGGKFHSPPHLPRNTVVFVPLAKSRSADTGPRATYQLSKSSTLAIFGAVQRPGVYPCYWKINILQALALAGGPRTPSALQELFIVTPNKPTQWFDLRAYLRNRKKQTLPQITPGSVVYLPTQPIGISRRGPIRMLGRVTRPGIIRGTRMRDFPSLLAGSGGPTGDADLSKVRVLYHGSNFTISQEVNVKKAFAEGRLDRLPPTPSGPMIVYIPEKRTASVALQETLSVVQLVIAITSIIASSAVLVVTLQPQTSARTNTTQPKTP